MLFELIYYLNYTNYNISMMIIVLIFIKSKYCLLINNNNLANI